MAGETIIYVADAGSASKDNFQWVCSRSMGTSSGDPASLANAIAADLHSANRVALGYESPLFVPLEAEAATLGCARDGECQNETGNRPFTAGAGASVLATGIQSLAWVLREIKRRCPDGTATTRWTEFLDRPASLLFVWEAFVSGSEKAFPSSHAGDAALAIEAFQRVMNCRENPTRIRCSAAFSLAGAAIIRAGLSTDTRLLSEPCVVLRPIFSPDESRARLAGYKLRQAQSGKKKAAAKPRAE